MLYSRAPRSTANNDTDPEQEAEYTMEVTADNSPASQQRLSECSKAQEVDPVCSLISKYCRQGQPEKGKIESYLKPFWKERVRAEQGSTP